MYLCTHKPARRMFTITACGLQHLDALLAVEKEALDTLERPDLLRRNTEQMWRACLQEPHLCLGAWVGEELAAFAVLYVPQPDDGEALAPLLTQVDAASYRAAHFKVCIVRPQWRGHGLQVTLGRQLHREARNRGYNLLCATASPHNTASIKSLQRLGYRADHTLTKYGFERTLFFCFN